MTRSIHGAGLFKAAQLGAALLWVAGIVRADDWSVSVNEAFFEGVPVAAEAEILVVSVDSSVLPHGEADAELIQYPKPQAGRLAESCGLDATPPTPFTLDCGVHMLGQEINGTQAVYYFLLKAHDDDWFQIFVSPQSGATRWIKNQHTTGLEMTPHTFADWLESQDSYKIAGDIQPPVQVLQKPEDSAKFLTNCASYEEGEGLISWDKPRHGDWISVTCVENGCFAVNDPARLIVPLLNLHNPRCAQGWTRWRGKDGRLILYPHEARP